MNKPFFTGILICLFFSSAPETISAQFISNPTAGITAIQNGLWSQVCNPSGLATENHFACGFYYQSAFMMQELANTGFAMSVSLGNFGAIGVSYQQFGYKYYKEQQTRLTIAKQLGKNVRAGVRFDYFSVAFGDNYGKSFLLSGTAGVQVAVTENLHVGFSIFNPHKAKFKGSSNWRYDSEILAGIGWKFGNHAQLALGAEKYVGTATLYTCTFDYSISKRFILQGGITNGGQPFFLGYVFRLGRIEIGMQSGYHELLGFSPQFSFNYRRAINE
jgi:hypothetical protein